MEKRQQFFEEVSLFIKKLYKKDRVLLHEPCFIGNEKKYLFECIESSMVSYVGEFVTTFENKIVDYTDSPYAIAVVNGTTALYIGLLLSAVERDAEVITPALTFVGTINPIIYLGAKPVFIDSEKDTLGIDIAKFEEFLKYNTIIRTDGYCYNRRSGRRISACIVVHVLGHPSKIDIIKKMCDQRNIPVIEDGAESLGSLYRGFHCGTFTDIAVLSFNGNKIVTTGGGGMILIKDEILARKARHITTTAKIPHPWEYIHDEIGYNFRLPNVNAALGVAQMEHINEFILKKRALAEVYQNFFKQNGINFFYEKENAYSNYWLNAIILKNRAERDFFLEITNKNGVMTRPIWRLIPKLEMFKSCEKTNLDNAEWLEDRLVCIPSGVIW